MITPKKKTPYNAKLCIYALLFYLQLDTSQKKILILTITSKRKISVVLLDNEILTIMGDFKHIICIQFS